MVWIIECKATDSLHKTYGKDTSLPLKQKKISQKEALDLTTRQNICKPKTMSKQKFAFQICLTHVLFPKITSKKRQMQTQERTGHFHVHSKEEWNMFHDGVNNRVQSNRQFPQDLRQWHKSSIEAEKNISKGSIGPYNTPKQLWTGKKIDQKSGLSIMFDPCVIPKDHKQKTADADTGENRSFPHPLQRGVEHVLRWCEYSSAKQPTVYTRLAAMTQVFHRSRKKYLTSKHWTLQHAKTTLNREIKSNKKVAFQLCSTHVLFPKITSKKRQMQTQERTGHFHVHSKEEWNMFYDCVNVRVQSNRQFTQDWRQWHKSSIEAGKKISQGSIGPYNTPKQLWTGKKIEQKSSLSIMFDPCVIPKDHKQKTADADTGENRSFPHPLQRGVEHVLRLCECSSAKQPTVYTRLAAMTQVFHRSKKNISQGSIGSYNTPKQLWTGEKKEQKKSPFNHVRPMCYSQRSQAKNARCRHRREQVISTSTPKRSGTCFTMVWIIECKATDSLHKTCGNDTSLPSKQKKNLTRKHWTWQHAKTTVNREKNQPKKWPFKYVRPMCYSQTSQA